MKRVTVLSQKGGSGKTTIAVHLAACAALNGRRTVLIDTDPQGSAHSWNESRGENILLSAKAKASTLQRTLGDWEEKADIGIIDTAPHSSSDAATIAMQSDYIVIPCRPARFDMEAVVNSANIARMSKVPFMIVVNMATRGKITKEARSALLSLRLPLYFGQLSNLVAYSHAVIDGRAVHEFEPAGKAAAEIACLYSMLEQELWDQSIDGGGQNAA